MVGLKRPNVTIKFNNFLIKNFLAPLSIKLNILDVCAIPSLIYSCECWGKASINSIEVSYRQGLKRALSIRETTNTEIVYIETKVYSKSPCTNSRFANISRNFGPNRKILGLGRAIVLLFILRAKEMKINEIS